MLLLISCVLIALVFSFLCSIMEAVLLSVTPPYLVALEKKGKRSGKILRDLKHDVDRPLAAILSLNTIAHTIGAACAGAQAAAIFGSASIGIFSAILTLLILVFSEIIPKTLGARYWRGLAPGMAYGLAILIRIMYPFVWLSRGITKTFSKSSHSHAFSREEITAMAEIGVRAGVFEERESTILRNLFRFHSLQAKDVMTPRTVVFALKESQEVEAVLEAHPEISFSRLPIYGKDIDDITGYVLKSDLLYAHANGQKNARLTPMKREIPTVPASLPLSALFERLLDRREHIALVVDEYGGTAGIVTIEDVVETLLGLEIMDEADTIEDMRALARAQWKKRAKRLGLLSEDD